MTCPKCEEELVATFDERAAKMPATCPACGARFVHVRDEGARTLLQEWKFVLFVTAIVVSWIATEWVDKKVRKVANPVCVWLQKAIVTSKWALAAAGLFLGWTLFLWSPKALGLLFLAAYMYFFVWKDVALLLAMHKKYGDDEWAELTKEELKGVGRFALSRKTFQMFCLLLIPMYFLSASQMFWEQNWTSFALHTASLVGLPLVIFAWHWADGTNVPPRERKFFEVMERSTAKSQG